MPSLNSFDCRSVLEVEGQRYGYFDLVRAERNGLDGISSLPFSMKVLLENLLRNEDGARVTKADILAFADWVRQGRAPVDILVRPTRVLMQDASGLPALVDLAAMRDAVARRGGDARQINPMVPVDLVIDHSVVVTFHGDDKAFGRNLAEEYAQNRERYQFFKWAQNSFRNFRVVPPGTGICHQINLEYLSLPVVARDEAGGPEGRRLAHPDLIIGTDSHTTMVDGLGLLGWGVGGVEAEAVMLGQPYSMVLPEVVGVRLDGSLRPGVTATDLVLTVTELLRKHGVVGKFVEFHGEGVDRLAIADRATVSNMAPEYGATASFFPIDARTIQYLAETGRDPGQVRLVEAYARAQGMYRHEASAAATFSQTLVLDLGGIERSLAGPKRPQDRMTLAEASRQVAQALDAAHDAGDQARPRVDVPGQGHDLGDGDIVIAAITSCTNTSNPRLMIGAGLLAKNAVERGLSVKPWVKTSLAPGSPVVRDYLHASGLQGCLDRLGFNLVGLGCTTCVGNSGALPEPIAKAIRDNNLATAAVLSGNRNFEGRVNSDVRINFLASPPLVIAYAIAGSMRADLLNEPLGTDREGRGVFLHDIWPGDEEIDLLVGQHVRKDLFEKVYGQIFAGDAHWKAIEGESSETFAWDEASTYIQRPPFFEAGLREARPVARDIVTGARILGLFEDSITTDHISPVGSIARNSPAGRYLMEGGTEPRDFNQYGARRGNHQVLVRGTFANVRLRNQMVPGVEGGVTVHHPSGDQMSIYDAAMRYQAENVPLVVIAGKEYGTGSARDWAAKGSALLGIKAVIARSFERIHRSNLIGMGIMPLCFEEGQSWQELGLRGDEVISIMNPLDKIRPRQKMIASVKAADGGLREISLLCRLDTKEELEYFEGGGILPHVLRQILH